MPVGSEGRRGRRRVIQGSDGGGTRIVRATEGALPTQKPQTQQSTEVQKRETQAAEPAGAEPNAAEPGGRQGSTNPLARLQLNEALPQVSAHQRFAPATPVNPLAEGHSK
jgi:hypothetical protein